MPSKTYWYGFWYVFHLKFFIIRSLRIRFLPFLFAVYTSGYDSKSPESQVDSSNLDIFANSERLLKMMLEADIERYYNEKIWTQETTPTVSLSTNTESTPTTLESTIEPVISTPTNTNLINLKLVTIIDFTELAFVAILLFVLYFVIKECLKSK